MGFNTKTDNVTQDQLVTPNFPILERGATVLLNQVLVRGSVMGMVTASSKLLLLDKDAVDGSEVPYGVLADSLDTTGADNVGPVFITGEFIEDSLVFEAGTDIDDMRAAMWAKNLYTKPLADQIEP